MRTFIVALGATACLPALAYAISIFPDPADPAASVPALDTPSVLADYRPYREQQAASWPALNRAVTHAAGRSGASHGSLHSGTAEAEEDAHSSHREGAAK
ncbi:hypothetical protein B0G80_6808 [Paraburkholderia sp. BL6669N2]|uniref:hypothetical protein n=1 Tax=Paraburkholderia sp. BL6669N2 TaxID=1938807 RepID=UPI000E24CA44|nr:hypothetical protein [Paraburkholderia sp. BL6669N2]REG50383.1 hypothetical protein B0G80_6808 [Paraburkholderia sp. BL6669N2]